MRCLLLKQNQKLHESSPAHFIIHNFTELVFFLIELMINLIYLSYYSNKIKNIYSHQPVGKREKGKEFPVFHWVNEWIQEFHKTFSHYFGKAAIML